MNKKIILLLSVLCFIAAAMAYYFLYFIKTPEYAINEIRESVQQHDVAKFQKHVNLKTIYNKGFDDIILAESKINHFAMNPIALGVINLMKPGIVELAIDETLTTIAREKVEKPKPSLKPGEAPENGNVLDAMKQNLQRKAHLKSLKFKDLKLNKTNKGKAEVTLVVTNTELNKDYPLLLNMLCTDDEVWEVREITNLAPTLLKMEAAYRAKRAAANQPIQERLKRALAFDKLQLDKLMEKPVPEDVSNYGLKPDQEMPHIVATLTITNNTNRTVNRIYYDLVLITKDKGQEIYSHPEHFDGTIPPGKMVQVVNRKLLNPLIPADEEINKADFSKLDWELRASYISFTDGHVISPNQFVFE